MLAPEIFFIATEAKDSACLEPLATALAEHGQMVRHFDFDSDLAENGGAGLKRFIEAPFPVTVISSSIGRELLALLRPSDSFLCILIEHGIAPFKSYTYDSRLVSADYYLAPTLGWAARLVNIYPEHRSKIRFGGYPKIDAIKDAISRSSADEDRRILVILSWGVREDSLRSLPDFPFIDYLLHPADGRFIPTDCMKQARVIISSPEVTYDLIGQASLVFGDFSSLTLECIHLRRDVAFLIDQTLYKSGCDLDVDFFDRNKAAFGVVPKTDLRVDPQSTIDAQLFRALIEQHGADIEAIKAAVPAASFPAEFLPAPGNNRSKCAAELLSIIRQESQLSVLKKPSDHDAAKCIRNMRLILRAYEALLGRAPDLAGLKHYLNGINNADLPALEAMGLINNLNRSPEAVRQEISAESRASVNDLTAILLRQAMAGNERVEIIVEALSDWLLPEIYRQRRDSAQDAAEKTCWGLKAICSPDAGADDFVLLAHSLAAEDKLEDALFWLSKAMEHFPEEGELHRFRASLLERMSLFEDALKEAFLARANGADEVAITADIDRISALLCASESVPNEADGGPTDDSGSADVQEAKHRRFSLRKLLARHLKAVAVDRSIGLIPRSSKDFACFSPSCPPLQRVAEYRAEGC